MQNIIKNMRRVINGRNSELHEITFERDADIVEASFWADASKLRMLVPTTKLCMQGAFFYSHKHPFVDALHYGANVLRDFYQKAQPQTLAQYHNITPSGLLGEDLPPWEIPWYKHKTRLPPPGEVGLDISHGVSFYGPATDDKIETEMERLLATKKSIQRDGYNPDKYGDIEGYVIRDADNVSFFVRGGKHRAAVLASLGYEQIPVIFHRDLPRLIDCNTAPYWPLVTQKEIDCSLAKKILRLYSNSSMNGRSQFGN